jgi:hypothetical protein
MLAKARPDLECGVGGCEFKAKTKVTIEQHQARVHGLGHVVLTKAQREKERSRKKREWLAQQPEQRCGVDGCEYQTKDNMCLKLHQARMHPIEKVLDTGTVTAEPPSPPVPPLQPVHGLGHVVLTPAEREKENKRKMREYLARRPIERCGVHGCEYQTRVTPRNPYGLIKHQELMHSVQKVHTTRTATSVPLSPPIPPGAPLPPPPAPPRPPTAVDYGDSDDDFGVCENDAAERTDARPDALPLSHVLFQGGLHVCGISGCAFKAKRKDRLKAHQTAVHGERPEDTEERRSQKAPYVRTRKQWLLRY